MTAVYNCLLQQFFSTPYTKVNTNFANGGNEVVNDPVWTLHDSATVGNTTVEATSHLNATVRPSMDATVTLSDPDGIIESSAIADTTLTYESKVTPTAANLAAGAAAGGVSGSLGVSTAFVSFSAHGDTAVITNGLSGSALSVARFSINNLGPGVSIGLNGADACSGSTELCGTVTPSSFNVNTTHIQVTTQDTFAVR